MIRLLLFILLIWIVLVWLVFNKAYAQTTSPLLTISAQNKADDECTRNYYDHANWVFFIEATSYKYTQVAENLDIGTATYEESVARWMASPLHRANIEHGYQDIGIGHSYCGGKNYWVQHFGNPSGVSAGTSVAPSTVNRTGRGSVQAQPPAPTPVARDRTFIDWFISLSSPSTLRFIDTTQRL